MKNTFIKTSDNEPKIEYMGTLKLLDILINKIDNTKDYEECRKYCQLYKMIYELLGSDE